jgi:ATP-binding cassette subfamily F protein 3
MVSHDRHLLATVSDTFLLVDAGQVSEFDGDLDDYSRWLARGAGTAKTQAKAAAARPAEPQPQKAKAVAAKAPAPPAKERKNLTPLRSRLARCEKRMQELAMEAKDLDTQLADPALYAATARQRQQDLVSQRARVAQETEAIEAEWLQVSEEIETAR